MDTAKNVQEKKSYGIKNTLFDHSSLSIEKIKIDAYKTFAKRIHILDVINGSDKIWQFMQLPDAFFIAMNKQIPVIQHMVHVTHPGNIDYRMLKKIFLGIALNLLLDKEVNQDILSNRISEITSKSSSYNSSLVLFQDLHLGKEVFKHQNNLAIFDAIPDKIAQKLNLEMFLKIIDYSCENGTTIKYAAKVLNPQPSKKCVIS